MQSVLLVRIAAGVLGVGVLFTVIGLGSNSWVTYDAFNYGLWKICSASVCATYPYTQGWLDASRAFDILSFLTGLGALVITILWALNQSITEKKIIRLIALIAAFASAGLGLLAIIIFGAEFSNFYSSVADLGWSYALAVIGALLMAVGGGLLFQPMREAPSSA